MAEIYTKELYPDNVEEVLAYLASVEKESDHPLAKAVVDHIGDIKLYTVEKTDVVKGGGVVAHVNVHRVALSALDIYADKKIDWSDAYTASQMLQQEISEIYSFDKHFDKIDGIIQIEP